MKSFAIVLLAAFGLLFFACGGDKSAKSLNLKALSEHLNTLEGDRAADSLVTLLREDPAGPDAPELALLLASVYETQLKDKESAVSVLQAIALAFPDTEAAKNAAERTHQETAGLRERIDQLRTNMFNPKNLVADPAIIKSYINSSMAYALLLPKDPESTAVLNQAAENAYYTQQYDRALYLYEWFQTAYPDDPKAPQAMFMRAFIYDNDLEQYETAGRLYQEFIQKHPDDDFADDAEVLLENLGKSPEEMMQSLEERAKEVQ
ncbi:MAG: tetratricopeptide repeat protein [Saprospiraceae bacterium]|nr:tetratricopeptide repeat protein [Saprospiraceae bacterium]